MGEQNVGEVSKEVILKPADLARSYLGHEGAQLIREIARTKDSIRFNETYKPSKFISSRVMPREFEIGGMDYSDWQNECLAAEQEPDDNESLVEDGNQKLNDLESDLWENCREFGKVVHGDYLLIDKYSRLEIERRARIEEAKKKVEQSKK
jgi:hypothetical protein